jgi:CheY-like chemotaxis protein
MDGIEMVTRYRLLELEAAAHETSDRSYELPPSTHAFDSGPAHDIDRDQSQADQARTSGAAAAAHGIDRSGCDRRRRLRPALPIVGMSANSDAAARALAEQAGMTAFLPKPFSIADVHAALATYQK